MRKVNIKINNNNNRDNNKNNDSNNKTNEIGMKLVACQNIVFSGFACVCVVYRSMSYYFLFGLCFVVNVSKCKQFATYFLSKIYWTQITKYKWIYFVCFMNYEKNCVQSTNWFWIRSYWTVQVVTILLLIFSIFFFLMNNNFKTTWRVKSEASKHSSQYMWYFIAGVQYAVGAGTRILQPNKLPSCIFSVHTKTRTIFDIERKLLK